MVELTIIVGFPASGKSTYAKSIDNVVVVSTDGIRKELFGDENIQGKASRIFQIAEDRIVDFLNADLNVVFDATNLRRDNRIKLIRAIKERVPNKVIKFKAIVMATPYEDCVERNEERERTVPAEVMERMFGNFQMPFYDEGFAYINTIYAESCAIGFYDLIEENKIPHDNPYHTTETITDHMRMAYYSLDKDVAPYVAQATLLHDNGKCVTKNYRKGDGFAHYDNHANWGAYRSLFIEEEIELREFIYRTALINYHMFPHKFRDKTIEEKRELLKQYFYDDDFIDMLLELHVADLKAH